MGNKRRTYNMHAVCGCVVWCTSNHILCAFCSICCTHHVMASVCYHYFGVERGEALSTLYFVVVLFST